MMVQKLSGITLLLLLCQHACFLSASNKAINSLVCEGGSAFLNCDLGFIHVLNANYGRTDRTTCSGGQRLLQLANVHCVQKTSLHTMSVRCNGKKSCSVSAKNSVFSDPCAWTYKYLQFSYECRPQRQAINCEGTQSVITCEKGNIAVHHANYGRRDTGVCPYILAIQHCYFPQTFSMRSRCNGKRSCHLYASNAVFSDPCYGVPKYLEVTYSCV